jgi:hypothetical protein
MLNRNKQDLSINRNVTVTSKKILQMQSMDNLARSIAAILAIKGLIEKKPKLSCATLLR